MRLKNIITLPLSRSNKFLKILLFLKGTRGKSIFNTGKRGYNLTIA